VWLSRNGRRAEREEHHVTCPRAQPIGTTARDADAALEAVAKLVEDKFGEGE
jgi:hypothetical protein